MSTTVFLIAELPIGLTQLADEARAEGFQMLARLIETFQSGENTFTRLGEALFGAERSGQLVGVGGLNIDPYFADVDVGRIRHLYVHPEARKCGVGRAIVAAIESRSIGRFHRLQLFTPTDTASRFYEALGYLPVSGVRKVSHAKDMIS